jgi:hypothetical protein
MNEKSWPKVGQLLGMKFSTLGARRGLLLASVWDGDLGASLDLDRGW